MPQALEIGLAELLAWGVAARPRGPQQPGAVMSDALGLGRYEAGRPSDEVAFRKGDERFIGRRPAVQPAGKDPEKPR